MPLDVHNLQGFYGSPLGAVARRLIGRVIRERWDNNVGLSVAAVGYGTPYLERFRDGARRCLALMPAEQGVVIWPGRRALLGSPCGYANAAASRRLDRPAAARPRSRKRPIGPTRCSRNCGASLRPKDESPGDRPVPAGRLGARRQHPLRAGPALFKVAIARSASSRRVLADLLGRGALRAPRRQAIHDPRRADDRTDGRGAWAALRRCSYRRGDQTGLSSGRRPDGRPRATASPEARPRAERPTTMPPGMIAGGFRVGTADCACF